VLELQVSRSTQNIDDNNESWMVITSLKTSGREKTDSVITFIVVSEIC
jgi:hypothetical protein